jgi:hypothetical protein
MEDNVQPSFSRAVAIYLKETNLHSLCQMVGCLTVGDRSENDDLDADDVYEMIRTLNFSGRALNDQINSKTIRGYAENLLKLAVMQHTRINFFAQLAHRAPLFTIKKLIVDNNELAQLPEELIQFYHLQELSAKNNQFIQFPPVLYAMNTLGEINMSHNQIAVIDPEGIAAMGNLKILSLHDNNLTKEQQQKIEQIWSEKAKNAQALQFTE